MVLLNNDFNVAKEKIWQGHKLLTKPTLDGNGKMMENEENSKTLDWLFINKYYNDKKVEKWLDNRGMCKAIYQFDTLMALVQYHNDPYIQEVMRAQVRRVGEAFDYVEDDIIPTQQSGYTKRNIKKEWIDWMKETHKNRLESLNEALEYAVKIFEKKSTVITKIKRWDFSGLFRREVKDPNCGFEPDDAVMEKRVKLLLEAYKKLPKVDTELKLD
ncbi:uncharacterized protein EI97DRAFT_458210 [Westerdykella ornata]|uniref:Uncharacterized protein n=1 Tax=Westerdykella ornata TaxID=318751 RepID=A0A6A6JMK6_WESOR|nr:uncharacterized protein EI97DRAFT_458210 [Westerdykella ornata]KAF2276886.1 hypothetical protein EI97DRAFT_458210 [Westerdykella ornata]